MFEKLALDGSLLYYRKISIFVSLAMTIILIVDTLTTRQILPYNTTIGSLLFILNIIIAYGIGSWVLFHYVKKISEVVIASKSFVDYLIKFAIILQFSLLILLSLIFVEFYIFDKSTAFLSSLTFAISSISASFIMSFTALKFFLWFRSSNQNKVILIYGLAAASIATAMIFDGGAKLLLVKIVEEPTLGSSPLQQGQTNGSKDHTSSDAFIYKQVDKYNGDVQYEVVKPDRVTVYVVPTEIRMLYQYLNGWIPITISFIFTWAITLIALRKYYQRQGKVPKKFYFVLTLPVVFYLLGRSIEFYTLFTGIVVRFDDLPNPYLFRVLFRIGVIGGSVLFGLAFFVIARITTAGKIKDCLTIAAIGATLIGISLSPSALQQTYGVAGRSLMLLSSLLFSLGFYLSAVYIARDSSIRKHIRSIDRVEFLQFLGHAQMEIEVEKKVERIAKAQQQTLKEESGINSSTKVDDYDIKLYIDEVMKEVKRKPTSAS
jgi:hypothetical protein